MPFILEADIAKQKKVSALTATDSALVAVLIPAVESFAQSFTRRSFEKKAYTEYFNGGTDTFFVRNLPLNSVTQIQELTSENPETYANWVGYSRNDPVTGEIRLDGRAANDWRGIKITYNGGFIVGSTWDAGYEDLRLALIELVVRKLDDATTGDKEIVEVEADGYREKYSKLDEKDAPADVLEVLRRYQMPQVG